MCNGIDFEVSGVMFIFDVIEDDGLYEYIEIFGVCGSLIKVCVEVI